MSHLRKAFIHIKTAQEYLADFKREKPGTTLGRKSGAYADKLQWILNDFFTILPLHSKEMNQFKNEINADTLFHEAISQKCLLLPPEVKEIIETLIDQVLAGETIQIEKL